MNTSSYNRTRWLTLFGTIVTQFALGSVYTWSLFNSALSDKLGAPISQVAFSFGLLSLGLALSSSVAGKLQERFGVKRVTMTSGILLGLGFPDGVFKQSDDALAERRGTGWSGGRCRLSAYSVKLRQMVPGA